MKRTDLVEQLKALGEPNRLAVALRLAHQEWGAGELLSQMEMSQPSLSRHLKVLREAGVIRERRRGRNAYYQLADDELPRLVVALAASDETLLDGSGRQETGSPDTKMHEGESISAEADDDEPKSSDIEEWLL